MRISSVLFSRVRRILVKSHQQADRLRSIHALNLSNNRKIQNDRIHVTIFVNRINQWNDHI